MNSPLELRKVRLRELGGQTLCGVSGTCASATGAGSGQVWRDVNGRPTDSG
jgi:hypothetical protein